MDRLGNIAAEAAMRAAADYIIRSGSPCRDYEALDAGMGQVPEATFLASMELAGIEAAKEVAL